jgi:hypothetical protein
MWSLKETIEIKDVDTDCYGDLTVKGAKDAFEWLVSQGYGDCELFIECAADLGFTGISKFFKVSSDGNKLVFQQER